MLILCLKAVRKAHNSRVFVIQVIGPLTRDSERKKPFGGWSPRADGMTLTNTWFPYLVTIKWIASSTSHICTGFTEISKTHLHSVGSGGVYVDPMNEIEVQNAQ